jgi:PAS domain S-box-containing protein
MAPVAALLGLSLAPVVLAIGGGGTSALIGTGVGGAVAELALSAAALVAVIFSVRSGARHRILKRETELLEQVFEHSPEAIALMDRDDRVLRGNAEFVRMFGYSADEAQGQTVQDLIIPADRNSDGALLKEALQAGETVSKESVRQRKDGTTLPVSITRTPIRVGGGEIAAFGVYRDISARRSTETALQKSEEKSHTILDHIDDGYYELDAAGKLVALNHAFCKILGRGPEELLGMDGGNTWMPRTPGSSMGCSTGSARGALLLVRWTGRSFGRTAPAEVWRDRSPRTATAMESSRDFGEFCVTSRSARPPIR